ncbi:Activator of Hsp90 ATPase AHSA1-like N-terminal domain-containing protein [Entamoeba marina]
MSEWNKISGNWSWEERDFSKWGKERIKEILLDAEKQKKHGYDGTIKVPKCDGDTFILFSHGHKRYIIQFDELKIIFAVNSNGEVKPSGSVMIEIDNENEYRFTYKTKPDDVASFEKMIKEFVEDAVSTLRSELQNKMP